MTGGAAVALVEICKQEKVSSTIDESREEATIRAELSEERGDVKESCAELG